MALQASDFEYELASGLIAQAPLTRRDISRLMVLDRTTGAPQHRKFHQIHQLLEPGDLLVLNDTRVVPAKFLSRRKTGGGIEGLFLGELHPGCWEVMLKGAGRCRLGERIELVGSGGVQLLLQENLKEGRWVVELDPLSSAEQLLARAGSAPLPPYIRRPGPLDDAEDRRRYQTVYASRPGAVAAPTAGLHFTQKLLDTLRAGGVQITCLTLHVGLGTFAPVKGDDLGEHKMHAEWYEVSTDAAEKLNCARSDGRRIIAVGTTTVRVLEGVAPRGKFAPTSGWTDIFIYPPAEFLAVDAMITNFHLPRSTLLMLVAAFCSPGNTSGVKMILDAYAEAIRLKYRFYSFGDAMLIV